MAKHTVSPYLWISKINCEAFSGDNRSVIRETAKDLVHYVMNSIFFV